MFSATFRAEDVVDHDAANLFEGHTESQAPSSIIEAVHLVNEYTGRFVEEQDGPVLGFNEVSVLIPKGGILDLLVNADQRAHEEACQRAVYQYVSQEGKGIDRD
jgi:hypothetical protein